MSPTRPDGVPEDPLRRPGRSGRARLHEERPKCVANLRWKDAFEILERRPSKLSVGRMQAAKSNLQRLSREDERQEGEDVREALARTVPYELVERRRAHESVQQTATLPDWASNCDLS